jgi:hypothetical protein
MSDTSQIEKTIWQILEEYCTDLKYGEINVKIIIHQGRGISFEETQPPIRKYRETKKDL